MKTSISTKGQIVLPIELRVRDHIQPGQQFEVERLKDGEYLLKRVHGPGQPGLVKWLLACPEKGWFEKLPSQSTADLDKRISGIFAE